jgi:hypothetical protein
LSSLTSQLLGDREGVQVEDTASEKIAITVLNETKGLKGVLDEINTVTELTPRVVEDRETERRRGD